MKVRRFWSNGYSGRRGRRPVCGAQPRFIHEGGDSQDGKSLWPKKKKKEQKWAAAMLFHE